MDFGHDRAERAGGSWPTSVCHREKRRLTKRGEAFGVPPPNPLFSKDPYLAEWSGSCDSPFRKLKSKGTQTSKPRERLV
jgi:hypothetical protein